MKAAIFKGPKNIEIIEMPDPVCGDNDIVVKNLYAAICGTDVHAYQHGGDAVRIVAGSEFGHEMVSEVVTVGKNVEGIKAGDRVYPYPMFCKDDTKRSSTVGGFSEYVLVPNCKLNHSVFLVDETIPSRVASMIEPFTVGTHAAKVAEPKAGQNAIVFGAGMIGLASAIALKHMGVDKVMIVDVADFRLQKAAELGFLTCNSAKENLKEAAMMGLGTGYGMLGETANADIYIEATGVASVIKTFQEIAKRDAVLSVVGIHYGPRELNLMMLTFSGHKIVGSPGYDFEDVRIVFDIMKSGKFDLDSIVTQEYPLDQLEEAILKAGNPEASEKVLISYV